MNAQWGIVCPFCGESVPASQSRWALTHIYGWPIDLVSALSEGQSVSLNCLAAMASDPREGLLRRRMRALMDGKTVASA